MPAVTLLKLNSPSLVDTVERAMVELPGRFTLMVAFGTAAPDASCTEPEMRPVDCAVPTAATIRNRENGKARPLQSILGRYGNPE